MLTLGLVLALFIGVSLGLLGGGGSILTVPVLVYVLGFGAKPAIAMSLPVVGVTSLLGASLHWKLGNVRVATAMGFGVLAMVGAFAGARLAVLFSGAAQLLLLAFIMLVAAVSMLRRPTARSADAAPGLPRLTILAPVAVGMGILTGLVGIGGGFLVVPALVLLGGVSMREAVGTSLLVIAMNSASGFAGYLGTVDIAWGFLGGFIGASVAGMVAGTLLSARVPDAALRRGFALLLLVMGGFVLYKNQGVLLGTHESASRTTSAATGAPLTRVASLR